MEAVRTEFKARMADVTKATEDVTAAARGSANALMVIVNYCVDCQVPVTTLTIPP